MHVSKDEVGLPEKGTSVQGEDWHMKKPWSRRKGAAETRVQRFIQEEGPVLTKNFSNNSVQVNGKKNYTRGI